MQSLESTVFIDSYRINKDLYVNIYTEELLV